MGRLEPSLFLRINSAVTRTSPQALSPFITGCQRSLGVMSVSEFSFTKGEQMLRPKNSSLPTWSLSKSSMVTLGGFCRTVWGSPKISTSSNIMVWSQVGFRVEWMISVVLLRWRKETWAYGSEKLSLSKAMRFLA